MVDKGAILKRPIVQRLATSMIGLYLDIVLRSGRWRIEADPASWKMLTGQAGQAAIVVFWHEYLPVLPVLLWRVRQENPALSFHALISKHRDGRMIAGVIRRWRIACVDGSSARAGKSDKSGASATRSLLRLLRQGRLVALTPDGPRGPRRTLQPGASYLAALSGAPIVPIAASCRPGRRLRSWDRMLLPLPFSRGVILCGAPLDMSRADADAGSLCLSQALAKLDSMAAAP